MKKSNYLKYFLCHYITNDIKRILMDMKISDVYKNNKEIIDFILKNEKNKEI